MVLDYFEWMQGKQKVFMGFKTFHLFQDITSGSCKKLTNTVNGTVTFEHSRWDNYITTKYMGQLHEDTVDGTVTLEHSRWDSYIRTQ